MADPGRSEFAFIQYLRGLAAMLVVAVHLKAPLERLGHEGYWPYFLESGVDIFFVISGFIMWTTTAAESTSSGAFLWRRFLRIAPLYWLVTTFIATILLLAPELVNNGRFDAAHIAASYLFIPAPHPVLGPSMYPVLVAGWTLNYEMYFYLIFALGLILPRGPRLALIAAALIGVSLLSLAHFPRPSLARFYTDSIVLEFLFGVLLAEAVARGFTLPAAASRLLLLLGFLLLPFGQILEREHGAARFLALGGPALMIVAGAVLLETRRTAASALLPQILGDASYSIYLTHSISLSAVGVAFFRLSLDQLPYALALYAVSALLAAALAGVATHLILEKPVLNAFRKLRSAGAAQPRMPQSVKAG